MARQALMEAHPALMEAHLACMVLQDPTELMVALQDPTELHLARPALMAVPLVLMEPLMEARLALIVAPLAPTGAHLAHIHHPEMAHMVYLVYCHVITYLIGYSPYEQGPHGHETRSHGTHSHGLSAPSTTTGLSAPGRHGHRSDDDSKIFCTRVFTILVVVNFFYYLNHHLKRDYIIIVDRSGSMSGQRWYYFDFLTF